MNATLLMRTRRGFGSSNRARLNRELLDAVAASAPGCEVCRDILRDVEPDAEGADYVEAPAFPGSTIDKLDAHFRFHWKESYGQVDPSR